MGSISILASMLVASSTASEASLAAILDRALAHNPDLFEAKSRTDAARARADAAGRLSDPELKYEQWGVPLARPYALDQANTLMLGLRQTFPAPGSLGLESRAASKEASILQNGEKTRALDIAAEVRRTFDAYYAAGKEYWIHLEHVELAMRIVELARANYAAGRGAQEDVLKTLVELSRLHRDISEIERTKTTLRARLNTLMARQPEAPLDAPREPEPVPESVDADALERLLASKRPEILAHQDAIERRRLEIDAKERTANWPSFMIGADYWLMPAGETHHAYSAMITVSLPWLTGRHSSEVDEAKKMSLAEARAFESVKNTARYQLHEAIARFRSTKRSLTILERDLLPSATKSFDAARAQFESGKGDALRILDAHRSLLDVKLEESRAKAALASAYADVERAAGDDRILERPRREGGRDE